jgi:hypothetical protein
MTDKAKANLHDAEGGNAGHVEYDVSEARPEAFQTSAGDVYVYYPRTGQYRKMEITEGKHVLPEDAEVKSVVEDEPAVLNDSPKDAKPKA